MLRGRIIRHEEHHVKRPLLALWVLALPWCAAFGADAGEEQGVRSVIGH